MTNIFKVDNFKYKFAFIVTDDLVKWIQSASIKFTVVQKSKYEVRFELYVHSV